MSGSAARMARMTGTTRSSSSFSGTAANPGLVGSDGVHATQVGYQTRASLYAQAVSACGG